jgi:hypothetical protein
VLQRQSKNLISGTKKEMPLMQMYFDVPYKDLQKIKN